MYLDVVPKSAMRYASLITDNAHQDMFIHLDQIHVTLNAQDNMKLGMVKSVFVRLTITFHQEFVFLIQTLAIGMDKIIKNLKMDSVYVLICMSEEMAFVSASHKLSTLLETVCHQQISVIAIPIKYGMEPDVCAGKAMFKLLQIIVFLLNYVALTKFD